MDYLLGKWLAFVLLTMGVFVLVVGWGNSSRVQNSADWPSVSGVVLESKIITKQRRRNPKGTAPLRTVHLPEIHYQYSISGTKLLDKQTYFVDQSPARVVKKYPRDAEVMVTYNPSDLNDSFLESPEKSTSYPLYCFGGMLVLIAMAMLLGPIWFCTSDEFKVPATQES